MTIPVIYTILYYTSLVSWKSLYMVIASINCSLGNCQPLIFYPPLSNLLKATENAHRILEIVKSLRSTPLLVKNFIIWGFLCGIPPYPNRILNNCSFGHWQPLPLSNLLKAKESAHGIPVIVKALKLEVLHYCLKTSLSVFVEFLHIQMAS